MSPGLVAGFIDDSLAQHCRRRFSERWYCAWRMMVVVSSVCVMMVMVMHLICTSAMCERI